MYRLFIPGKGILILALFLSLNKYILSNRITWLALAALLFFIIIFHVIRQVIAFSFIVSLFYFFRNVRFKFVWLALIGIFAIYFINIKLDNNTVLGKLFATTEHQIKSQKSGEDDIRIREYKFFFSEYSPNFATKLLGNGVAHEFSALGQMEKKVQDQQHYYASDVGYAEIFIRFGVIGLLLYGIIFFRVILQKVPDKFIFAKLYIVYLLMANVAASWIFHDTIIICISLYILEMAYKDRKRDYYYYTLIRRYPRLSTKLKTLYT